MDMSRTRRQILRLTGAAVLGLMLLPLGPMGQARAADAAGLVGALTSQLGVTPAQAEGGAGAMFGLARQRMAPEQYGEVERSVPGIGDLVSRHGSGQATGQPQHGMGGGLGGMAGDALGNMGGAGGGGLGALAPIAGQLSGLGISPQTASRFLPVVMQYLSGNGAGNAAGLLKGALGG